MLEPTDPSFKILIGQANVKEVFESTALFYEIYKEGSYRMSGTWVGDRWFYDEPLVQEHYNTFSEGFISGVADYYISSEEEKTRAEKRMKTQMYEKDDGEKIVLDISQYLK